MAIFCRPVWGSVGCVCSPELCVSVHSSGRPSLHQAHGAQGTRVCALIPMTTSSENHVLNLVVTPSLNWESDRTLELALCDSYFSDQIPCGPSIFSLQGPCSSLLSHPPPSRERCSPDMGVFLPGRRVNCASRSPLLTSLPFPTPASPL